MVAVGGGCMVARGHAWLPGGVHGCWGACMVARGCAWLPGGMHGCPWGGGHVWLLGGACMVAKGYVGYDEIR